MDFPLSLLSNPEFQGLVGTLLNLIVTAAVGIAVAAFTRFTGIRVEQAHQDSLHRAVKSAVESALYHGPKEAGQTIKAHVVQHLRESVPDALKALAPGDGVLDRLIDRYVGETLNKIGEPK